MQKTLPHPQLTALCLCTCHEEGGDNEIPLAPSVPFASRPSPPSQANMTGHLRLSAETCAASSGAISSTALSQFADGHQHTELLAETNDCRRKRNKRNSQQAPPSEATAPQDFSAAFPRNFFQTENGIGQQHSSPRHLRQERHPHNQEKQNKRS